MIKADRAKAPPYTMGKKYTYKLLDDLEVYSYNSRNEYEKIHHIIQKGTHVYKYYKPDGNKTSVNTDYGTWHVPISAIEFITEGETNE